MRVMSWDQSTRVSGYAVFDQGKYVCSGVIDKSKSELDTYERSFEMAKDIWAIIDKYKPDEITVDGSVIARMEAGNVVGDLAMGLFGDFVG